MDAKDAAKRVGMILFHFGQLKPYTKRNKPEVINVKGGNVTAAFNVWFSTDTKCGGEMTLIIAETAFVKQVRSY